MATPYRVIRRNATTGLNEEINVEGTEAVLTKKVSLSLHPKFSCYVDGNVTGNSAAQNVYIRANGTWIIQNAVDFSLLTSPAADNNKIQYTGADPIHVCIEWSVAVFASTDNQTTWVVPLKNSTVDTYGPHTVPNLPPLAIPGSVMKTNGRNLNAVLITSSGRAYVDLSTNDTVRFYMANVTSGSGVNLRDVRISISTVRYL